MRFRPSAGTLLASLLWSLPGVIILPQVAYAQTAAKTALVTAVRGNALTLAIGTADGAKVGQTYRLSRGGVGAKVQITSVSANESIASVLTSDAGYIVTVGETAAYLGEEPVAVPVPAPVAPSTPLPSLPPAPPQTTTQTATIPAQALVTSVTRNTVTLGIGTADGAVLGAVYALPLDGDLKARLQITAVRANDSVASLSILEEGFTPTVGEITRFLGVETILVPAPAVTPAIPDVPASTATPSSPSLPTNSGGTGIEAAPVSLLSGSTASVTSISGKNVIISAGRAQGVRPAQNVPILRAGQVIGLLRVQSVNENSSSGVVLYSDDSISAISPGDAVGILGAAPGVGSPVLGPITPATKVPATLVQFETGASNESVPKADPTYELLASLAAGGLIQSQPASVFQDEGARRHRTAEDIIFSRAQIAGFIREAIANVGADSGRGRAALGILTRNFRRDLISLGETDVSLAAFRTDGVSLGVSGFTRLTGVKGNLTSFSPDPFGERFGALRSRTGYDARTNVFGQISSQLSFYGSFDRGNDRREGNDIISNTQVRKAYVSYDANKLLRGLTVNLGRREFWWGPGQFGTAMLGDAPGGLDSLSTSFERGSYRLEGLYARLGRGPLGGDRSLYAQRVTAKIGNSVRVGTTSSVLTADRKFDPKYFLTAFSPLSLYLVKGKESQGAANDNSLLGGFVEATVAKGARIYGELFIDDLSLKTIPAIENRTGSIVGAQFFNPKDPAKAGFKAEFARFNSYSYLAVPGGGADNPDYYYQFRNSPLGYPVAPVAPTIAGGAESLRFEGYYSPIKRLRIFAGIEFADINSGDQNQAINSQQGFSRQQTRRIAVAYDISRAFTLTLRGQENRTDQPNFLRGERNQLDKFVSLEIARSF
ncbi:MAG TPA: hypothetical protein VGB45_04790 [Abditibacterium sp.]